MPSVNDYLKVHAGDLVQCACATPLHQPGVDFLPSEIQQLSRRPFPAQADAIAALVQVLNRQKCVLLAGEPGVGKTLMSIASVHCHAGADTYRSLVVTPPQVARKFCREILHTVPRGATVELLRNWSQVAEWGRTHQRRPTKPEWVVIPRDITKLGPRIGNLDRCPQCYSRERQGSKCADCGEHLWEYLPSSRWIPARYIKDQLPGWFDYLVLDEAHELSGNSAQSEAAGALIAACGKVIAMSGTISNGRADHLRPILFRMFPESLRAQRLKWGDELKFSELYGRIEVTETRRYRNGKSSSSRRRAVRPGIMPRLYSDLLLENCVFVSLDEMSDQLPEYDEQVRLVEMSPELAAAYRHVESTLAAKIREMLAQRDFRLVSKAMHTLLAYPDYPWDWEPIWLDEELVIKPPDIELTRTPKEVDVVKLCKENCRNDRQTWLFAVYTGITGVPERYKSLLEDIGLVVKIMPSSVPPLKREEWIKKHAPLVDVMISHPEVIGIGMDLFGEQHNFPELVFIQTGHELNVVRQAARRAWRIAQVKRCRTTFFAYANTAQSRCLDLMAMKISAAQSIEGKLSPEGLAALCDDESLEIELARQIVEALDVSE